MLKRAWWKYYDPKLLSKGIQVDRLPKFQMILLSADTPLKDKETSDFVALQAWGVIGADRYLLDSRKDRLSYDQAKRAIQEMSTTMRRTFKHTQHACLIENAGYGVELIQELKRSLDGVYKISVGAEGNKTMRALSASADLETGNCFLPGWALPELSGPDPNRTPAWVIDFIDECTLFDNGPNDDQVDAWSQAMNWLRSRAPSPLRTASALRTIRTRNPFIGTTRRG
jgi:predicted phage terminase large subunit-like protein